MNKYGWLSLIMVGLSIVLSFSINDDIIYPGIYLIVFFLLSILGIIFAFLSKKITNTIIGVVLNSISIVFFFFLILAMSF